MGFLASARSYASLAFRWQRGRQGTGYDKMLLLTARWPLRFDSYLIRYPEGSEIPPHTDPVQGKALVGIDGGCGTGHRHLGTEGAAPSSLESGAVRSYYSWSVRS